MMSDVKAGAGYFTFPSSVTDFGDVSFYDDQGDLALTNFPFFYEGGNSRWAIYGNENGWECDTLGSNDDYNTLHRIWVQ